MSLSCEMDCSSLTIQSRALYAVDLMLEWRDSKGEWAGVWLSMGCHTRAVHESRGESRCHVKFATYDIDSAN